MPETEWTFIPGFISIEYGNSLEPGNTGGWAEADNPSGVTIEVTYDDESDQDNDPSDCGHYNYTITRNWTATDIACNTTIEANQTIEIYEVDPPVWTYFPPDITTPQGGSIHPDETGWAEGEDPVSGEPVIREYEDELIQQTTEYKVWERSWRLGDICNDFTNDSIQTITQDISIGIIENGLSGLMIKPNPFTTSTTIEYELKQPEKVTLTIYDHLGQIVYQTEENQPQGQQQLLWNAEGYANGIYYYRLQIGDAAANGKMVKSIR